MRIKRKPRRPNKDDYRWNRKVSYISEEAPHANLRAYSNKRTFKYYKKRAIREAQREGRFGYDGSGFIPGKLPFLKRTAVRSRYSRYHPVKHSNPNIIYIDERDAALGRKSTLGAPLNRIEAYRARRGFPQVDLFERLFPEEEWW